MSLELNEWEIHINEIKLKDQIGEGQFGKVFLASWRGTNVVAKVINDNMPEDKKYLFIKEFDIMTKVHHPYVVQLLGYVKDPFIIVMEYLNNGNLLEYIRKNRIWKKTKINLALDILRGLAYIHARRPDYLIHRDIKSHNILISPGGFAKIGDFGLAKCLKYNITDSNDYETNKENEKKDNDMTTFVGSVRYMSPEMKSYSKYSFKTDIWSCGVIFYELFENGERYNPKGVIWSNTPNDVKVIIKDFMLKEDPNDRLTALELITKFEDILVDSNCCF